MGSAQKNIANAKQLKQSKPITNGQPVQKGSQLPSTIPPPTTPGNSDAPSEILANALGISGTPDNIAKGNRNTSLPGLNDTLAEKAVSDLTKVMLEARGISRSDMTFDFPSALCSSIIEKILALREFVRRRSSIVFWDLIEAIDHSRPAIKLKKSLDQLFGSLNRVEPGELTTISRNLELPHNLRQLAVALRMQLCDHPHQVPSDLLSYRDLLKFLQPREYDENVPTRISDRLAFLEIYIRYMRWQDNFGSKIDSAYGLALNLEHQPYLDLFRRLLDGEIFDTRYIRPSHAKGQMLLPKWKKRGKFPGKGITRITCSPSDLKKWEAKLPSSQKLAQR